MIASNQQMRSIRDIIAASPTLTDIEAKAVHDAQPPEPRDVDLTAARLMMMRRPEGGQSVADRLDDAIADAETSLDVRRAARDGQRLLLMPLAVLPTTAAEWQQLAASLTLLAGAGVIPADRVPALSVLLYVMPPEITLDDVAAARRAIKVEGWRDAKLHADAAASAIIDADPDAEAADVGAAYTAELIARRTPPAPEGGEG